MVFSSVLFLCIFLPIVLFGYYILPRKARNIWLLIGSLVFYAWGGPKYLIFLLTSVVANYVFGLLIHKTASEDGDNHPAIQKTILIIAVVLNLSSLVFFKYAGMIVETVRDLFNPNLIVPQVILPLGISFYTFQCMSYIIDVYRGQKVTLPDGSIKDIVDYNFIDFALYITMFPQLLQGPIIRYADVRNSLKSPSVNISGFSRGLERFIIGFAKKALIANTLGETADNIFAYDPSMTSSAVAWLGAILYTLQIYYDFSGYSDMAIGLGRLFGFEFMENFNYPYISKSITEFWRRWHISLSRWFRDYLYIPLGGNRKGNVYINLIIVFLATGIWHGAAWGFLVWGLWHGIFMLIERAFKGKAVTAKIPGFVKWIYTMLVVSLGWVLFKLEELGKALTYIGTMFHVKAHEYNAFSVMYFLNRRLVFFIIVAVIAMIPWAQLLPRYVSAYIADFTTSDKNRYRIPRYILLVILLVISIIFTINNTYTPFIYFKF